jgi:hypothetical protein
MFKAKKNLKIFGVKPILSLIYFIYAESKNANLFPLMENIVLNLTAKSLNLNLKITEKCYFNKCILSFARKKIFFTLGVVLGVLYY